MVITSWALVQKGEKEWEAPDIDTASKRFICWNKVWSWRRFRHSSTNGISTLEVELSIDDQWQ